MNTTTITPIKTKYNARLEQVYNRLQEGRRKVADLTPQSRHDRGVNIRANVFGRSEQFSARGIGANSFGLEVCLKDKYNCASWVAIESLTPHQQHRIVQAIDWSTLS